LAIMGEIVGADGRESVELVEVALAADPAEAGMIQGLLEDGGIPSLLEPTGVNGPMLGIGLLPPGPQRVRVHADQADAARRLLAETLVEGGEGEREADWDKTANAGHLAEAGRGKPREYGLIGAYARIWLWSLTAIGAAFLVFLLLRG
jgi:hypothetical protein